MLGARAIGQGRRRHRPAGDGGTGEERSGGGALTSANVGMAGLCDRQRGQRACGRRNRGPRGARKRVAGHDRYLSSGRARGAWRAMRAWATRCQADRRSSFVGLYAAGTMSVCPSDVPGTSEPTEDYAGSGYPGLQPARVAGVCVAAAAELGTAWTTTASACESGQVQRRHAAGFEVCSPCASSAGGRRLRERHGPERRRRGGEVLGRPRRAQKNCLRGQKERRWPVVIGTVQGSRYSSRGLSPEKSAIHENEAARGMRCERATGAAKERGGGSRGGKKKAPSPAQDVAGCRVYNKGPSTAELYLVQR
jgi:hypothetical protein